MSNLQVRTLSSIAFVILILGPLFLEVKIAFTLYAVLGGFTLNELLNVSEKSGTSTAKAPAFVYYGLFTVFAYEWLFYGTNWMWILLLSGSIFIYQFVAELFNQNTRPIDHIALGLVAPLFTASSFIGLAYFYVYRTDLPSLIITICVFGMIWINDSGAYLIGRKLGKTKLFERLSPNKTWEGSIGGAICAMSAGFGISFMEGMPNHWFMAGFALVCVIFGSLGDLFESRMKRAAGVKDSGRFLPGHGGFFDRFDAMMLAVPASILYFETFLPKT